MYICYDLILSKMKQEIETFNRLEVTYYDISVIRTNRERENKTSGFDIHNKLLSDGDILGIDKIEGIIEINDEYEDEIWINDIVRYFIDINNNILDIYNDGVFYDTITFEIYFVIIIVVLRTRFPVHKLYKLEFQNSGYLYFGRPEKINQHLIPYDSPYFKDIKLVKESNLV